MSEFPSWLPSGTVGAARAWSVAQLAAQIAPGICAIAINPATGEHRGHTSESIACEAINIARAILDEVGLGEQ